MIVFVVVVVVLSSNCTFSVTHIMNRSDDPSYAQQLYDHAKRRVFTSPDANAADLVIFFVLHFSFFLNISLSGMGKDYSNNGYSTCTTKITSRRRIEQQKHS